MSRIQNDRIAAYDTTSASAMNTLFTDITSGSIDINETNVRSEGIDTRQLSTSPFLIATKQQVNGYALSLGDTAAAGATYEAYSKNGGSLNKEVPLNHDDSGATSTTIGDGTKLQFSSTSPPEILIGDIVEINWSATLWEVVTSESMVYMGGDKVNGSTFTGNEGAGYGEWCWFIYPKVNVTDNTLDDDDFKSIGEITSESITDLSEVTAGLAHSVGIETLPHVSVVPTHYLQSNDTAGEMCAARYARGDQLDTDQDSIWMRPRNIRGSFAFSVDSDETLYGLQLYIGGYWRLHTSSGILGFFLEDEYLNLTITERGVSEGIAIERAKIGAQIFRSVA